MAITYAAGDSHLTSLVLGGAGEWAATARATGAYSTGTTKVALFITPEASAATTSISYHKLVGIGDVTGTTAFGFGDPTKPTTGIMASFGRTAIATATLTDTGLDIRVLNKLVNTGANTLQGAYIKAKNYSTGTVGGDLVGLFIETVQDGTCSGSSYGLKIGCDGSTITSDIILRNGATINNSAAAVLTITEGTIALVGAVTASSTLGVTGDLTLSAGVVTQAKTVSTDALGTVRGGHFQVTTAGAGAIASGNTVGVRGVNTLSGIISAGGAYLYGAQGKLVVTGTMNHADARLCSMLAQLDGTGGTFTTGQLSGLWIDMLGLTTGGGQFNGIRMTGALNVKPQSLIYAQCDADFLLDLVTVSGGAMSYVVAAGTSSGSFGNADGVATKVIKFRHDGTTYYIPAHTQNT